MKQTQWLAGSCAIDIGHVLSDELAIYQGIETHCTQMHIEYIIIPVIAH